MKQTVSFNMFVDAFNDANRQANFTYEGLTALFDYLEEYEESTGEQIEFDMVAICCDFSEYADFKEIQDTYPHIKDMQDLQDHTQVIEFDGGVIIQNF